MLGGVFYMTNQEKEYPDKITLYISSIYPAKLMHKSGLISKKELRAYQTKIANKYGISLDTILCTNIFKTLDI